MSRKGIQRLPGAGGALTLLDFADALSPRGKARKGTLQTIKVTADLSEDSEVDNDDLPLKPKKKRRARKQEDPNHVYNDYHIDIWFLISEYIRPELVGRFALICRKTEAVVASAKFWLNLYKRYYNPCVNLPERLKPHLIRLGGLRCNVISSLFYTYPPLAQKLQGTPNINILLKLENVGMWYKIDDKAWLFCYRFFNRIKTRKPPRSKCSDADDADFEDFLSQFNNIFANAHEGRHILVVFSKRFIPFPDFHGQRAYLKAIRQPISQDLRQFNLELTFCNYRGEEVASMTYDSVLKFRVISWWDPDYSIFST